MVASMSSPFISEEIAVKNISIFIFVLSRSVFESVLEPAFKKELIVSIEFASSMEGIVPPISFIPEVPIELIHSKTNPLTSLKLTIVLIPIFVDSFPLAMRERISPKPHILNNVIFLLGLISEHSFTIELALPELSLVPGPMGKLVDPMTILFVIEPISSVRIAVGPGVGAVAVHEFIAELSLVFVSVAKIQSVPHNV